MHHYCIRHNKLDTLFVDGTCCRKDMGRSHLKQIAQDNVQSRLFTLNHLFLTLNLCSVLRNFQHIFPSGIQHVTKVYPHTKGQCNNGFTWAGYTKTILYNKVPHLVQ